MPNNVPEDIRRDLLPFHIPKLRTFEYLHKMIPDANHISSYPTQLVVELHPLSEEAFIARLATLPSGVGSLSIGYVNGNLLDGRPQARVKAPNPTHLEGECDDSDYLAVENGASLRPGILLESRGIKLDDGSTDGIMWTNS